MSAAEEERLKQLTTEARQAIKDLRAEQKAIDEYIRVGVQKQLDAELGKALSEIFTDLAAKVNQASSAIFRRFDKLEERLMGGKKKVSIETLIEGREAIQELLARERARLGKDDT